LLHNYGQVLLSNVAYDEAPEKGTLEKISTTSRMSQHQMFLQ